MAAKGGASEPTDTLPPGNAGGAVAVRRTLASTICRVADPLRTYGIATAACAVT